MKRSKRILVVCHCLLNANAKVSPLATCPGVCLAPLSQAIEDGVGLVQLPCPETAFLGMKRFGMTREQYDTPAYRRHCRAILEPTLDQLEAFAEAGYALEGVVGVNGSPSCGVSTTCFGYRGGELSAAATRMHDQLDDLRFGPGAGVFMDAFLMALQERELSLPLFAVDEEAPDSLLALETRRT